MRRSIAAVLSAQAWLIRFGAGLPFGKSRTSQSFGGFRTRTLTESSGLSATMANSACLTNLHWNPLVFLLRSVLSQGSEYKHGNDL